VSAPSPRPFGRFFLPGPTEVRPEILAEMARPVIGHRGPELSALLREADPMLRLLFGTQRPVFVSTSSATALMEASVRGGVRRRALCLANGAFSERYAQLVDDCGGEGVRLKVPWGEAHTGAEVERELRRGGFDAVTVVHSETSTGVLQPLPELARAVRTAEEACGEEILLLVDGVTSVGGMAMETDAWGLDFLLTGSQKALALPPGLAFGSASERLLERAARLPGRGQYLDVVEFVRQWAEHQTPNTPAVSLLYALLAQLRAIEEETLTARAARHREMAERCWSWAAEGRGAELGCGLFAPEGRRSLTVTAFTLPPGRSGTEVTGALARRGWTVAPGYGRLREEMIRIGHMGDHTPEALEELLGELEAVLG
jgi:aspartate aminotransferase-like enzyme